MDGTNIMQQSYTYQDIGLVPQTISNINSRLDVDTSTTFLGLYLKLPIIAAPMTTVVGFDFAKAIRELGGIACLPRSAHADSDLQLFIMLQEDYDDNKIAAIPSISATGDYIERAGEYVSYGATHLCVDVANGAHYTILNACETLKKKFPDIHIITGNIGSAKTFQRISDLSDGQPHRDIAALRVGIGNGSACSTSTATGIGQGQATLIRDIKNCYIQNRAKIIADGGIKTPGHMCIALALGADIVMCGGIFAGCEEAETLYYAGQASKKIKGNDDFIEGQMFTAKKQPSLKTILKSYEDGLRSSMAYMNKKTLSDFKSLPDECFTILSHASKIERTAHYS